MRHRTILNRSCVVTCAERLEKGWLQIFCWKVNLAYSAAFVNIFPRLQVRSFWLARPPQNSSICQPLLIRGCGVKLDHGKALVPGNRAYLV